MSERESDREVYVVIVPIPAPGLEAPDPIHATVTKTDGATLHCEDDDGERYQRRRDGQISRAEEHQTRAGVQTFWSVLATDSELRRVEADGGTDLGVPCDVEDCESQIVGLDDGWEFGRGIVCQSCIDYRNRHGHWPDDDAEICVECKIDDGAVRHECEEASALDGVLVDAGEDCPYCGETQREAMADGGTEQTGTEQDEWPRESSQSNEGGPVDHCDDCGDPLAYPGNRLGGGTYCDGCYDALLSVLPAGGSP